ncbi:MAG: dethiobiotin synthase [Acidiferrobacterales bacterium]
MTTGWFVTGTDTEVGKTLIATGLLSALRNQGLSCVGMKPVASGCEINRSGSHHCEDAQMLLDNSSVRVDYIDVNPYGFAPAVAPHLAAHAAGVDINLEQIRTHFDRLCAQAECIVVEGIGGWLVPLNEENTTADLARLLGLPVILVAGVRLGCLNHTLLTVAAIAASGAALAGWVANRVDPDVALFEENVVSLQGRINAPLLGMVPYGVDGATPAFAARHLKLSHLRR